MQSNRYQNPPPQLSKIIFVAGSTDPDHLACVKLGATKLPNKMSSEAFAARFCASCSALKLLKPPSYASLRSWRDFARECFCFGREAVSASGEAVRGLVKSRVEFTRGFAAREFPRGLRPPDPRLRRCSPAHESRQLRRLRAV